MTASLANLDTNAMTPEVTALCLAALLQVAHFALYSIRVQRDVGSGYAMSPRDRDPSRPVSLTSGRLSRALDNHFDALTLFAPAALIIALTGQSTPLTATLAYTYLAARIAYVPAYAFGWTPWRSVIWAIGLVATTALYLVALL